MNWRVYCRVMRKQNERTVRLALTFLQPTQPMRTNAYSDRTANQRQATAVLHNMAMMMWRMLPQRT
jgi:hypothetical protein